MNRENLERILEGLLAGELSKEQAADALGNIDYEDLGYARLDHNRALRTGVPEVVFCQGKSDGQIADIFGNLARREPFVIGTRLAPEVYERIKDRLPSHEYDGEARLIWHGRAPSAGEGFAAVLSGGTADIPVAREAAPVCSLLGTETRTYFDVGVAGLHRLLAIIPELRGAGCIVAAAGMEGTLPGVVAGLVPCPVIALPTSVGYGTGLRGVSALLTMLNSCAPGLCVVNIDNGFGAGYLAHKITNKHDIQDDINVKTD
ncbi:MAG: nickel pincer cofactor biosynthesis protein LarB [Abditibacteriota bacterium]|nr:nickel pincer cofactor biosynthesis protein LarB [Abditibacteriota bacterium]